MAKPFVQFLGSGDAFSSGGRLQTCIYADLGKSRFLLDCGASAMVSIKRWQIDPATIDAILITHLHGDHFAGIPFFVLDAQLVTKRTRPLLIAGPQGLESRVKAAMEVMFPGSSKIRQKYPIAFVELVENQAAVIDSLTVTGYPVVHASGATPYALRVECGGKVVAYSGDTEWTDCLVAAAKDADLFISEAYFYDKQVKNHLSYKTLLERKSELTCRWLMMTHMSDDMLGRLDGLEIDAAEDGKRVYL
ncbi:MAG: MBL fold metallo-hydrolase [Desulfobacterales bacterium]|nr:MBL fold metallo-hydrolase [Desulfobacterales bacterium]